MFVAAVTSASAANSNATAQEEPSTTTSSEDKDYGYMILQLSCRLLLVNHSFMLVQIVPEWKHWIILMTEKRTCRFFSGYPNVCATFLKYNTSLPSSAPVEQFSALEG